MNKKTNVGNIEIKPAKNGFLIVCNLFDEPTDPAMRDPFAGNVRHRQEIFVHEDVSDALVTIDSILRNGVPPTNE